MHGLLRVALGGVAAMVMCCGVAAAQTREPYDRAFIAASAGGFGVLDDDTTAVGQLEYRSDYRLWLLRPLAGVMATSDGALYGYAGLRFELPLADRLMLTASAAPGAYSRGNDRDLGYGLEFFSRVELSYRFADESRLGLAFGHMSNAQLGDRNPGVETLMLTYALPVSRLLGQ